jgi:NAD(P)-dependent dehydrogenase (short-subunit alcohol dehydrogenase family)
MQKLTDMAEETDSLSFFMPDMFRGKTVFVTGGGSGINLGIAKGFARLGANVAICGRDVGKLDAAVAELRALGAHAAGFQADVRDKGAVDDALRKSDEQFGPVDVLVCGAAGNFLCAAEDLSSNGFRAVVDIDLVGAFHAAHAAFTQLRQTRGSILFISAGQAFQPFVHQVHVGAAKAGIDNMMRNLAFEWGRFGIRSNSIAPGFIADTEGTKRMAADGLTDRLREATPLGRLGEVEDIANMATFLASPLATYVTGGVFVVDGGHYLGGSGLFSATVLQRETSD